MLADVDGINWDVGDSHESGNLFNAADKEREHFKLRRYSSHQES